jgi:hypothetical protein
MATAPQFTATPKVGITSISTANTARDGSGTIGTVFSAGSNGSRIDEVIIQATGNTTAGMVRLFLHDGSASKLIGEQAISAATVSASVVGSRYVLTFANLSIPAGYSLRASTHNAEAFNVVALGGDY